MIKFELSNKEIIEIPESKANKISFFRGLEGFKKQDSYDFSQFSIPTMNVLLDYLYDKELLQTDVKDNEELFALADYLGDDKFSYEIKKADTLAKSKYIISILRERLYELPPDIDHIGLEDIFTERKYITGQKLTDIFESVNYDYNKLLDIALNYAYDNEDISTTYRDFLSNKIYDLRSAISTKGGKDEIYFQLKNLIEERNKIKKDLLQEFKKQRFFNEFEDYLMEEDAYYLWKAMYESGDIIYEENLEGKHFYIFGTVYQITKNINPKFIQLNDEMLHIKHLTEKLLLADNSLLFE